MSDKKKFKHHLICMKCRMQSTGKTVKECEKTFGNCGISGGPLNDACKTTLYLDGKPVYKLVLTDEFEKLLAKVEKQKAKTTKEEPMPVTETTEPTPKPVEESQSKPALPSEDKNPKDSKN